MATPTAAMGASMEARLAFAAGTNTSTSGTQTGDYKCRRCDEGSKTTQKADPSEETTDDKVRDSREKQGCQWARDELLRLRDELAKMPGATETGNILFRTAPITACPI